MSVDENLPLDPRIQLELEKLNAATENINKFEIELDEAKSDFRKLLEESIERIKFLASKLENSIAMAKPYYQARIESSKISKNTQDAAVVLERARSSNAVAKEMVYLAEQGLGKKSVLDTACQEMLSHATSRVNETQKQCIEKERLYKLWELKQELATNNVSTLQSQLKSAIKTSSLKIRRHLLLINIITYQHGFLFLPYYESRANNIGALTEQKESIINLERNVTKSKMSYNETLRNLELISEEIHKMRDEKYKLLNELNFNSNINLESRTNNMPNGRNCKDKEHVDYMFSSKESTSESDVNSEFLFPSNCNSENEDSKYTDDNNIENEKWTEILLSDPYMEPTENQSNSNENLTNFNSELNEENEKLNVISCNENPTKYSESLTNWITKSNLKNKERRQSLDILYDVGDRFKDAFTQGIQKVNKTLERRNSESEASMEFFAFNRSENLTDEQIENLHLNRSISSIYEDLLNVVT